MNPFFHKPFFLKEEADNTKPGTPEKKESPTPPPPPERKLSENKKAEKKLESAADALATPQPPPTKPANTPPEVKIPEDATYETI